MRCVFIFRKRAAEIKKYLPNALRAYIFRQILGAALYKTEIANFGIFRRLARGNYHVSVLFNRNNIRFGVAFCIFYGKAALTAAYFKKMRRRPAEPFIKINIFGILRRIVEVSVLKVTYKKQLGYISEPFLKVLFLSHSHISSPKITYKAVW